MLKAAVRNAEKAVQWMAVYPDDPNELPPAQLASYGDEEPDYVTEFDQSLSVQLASRIPLRVTSRGCNDRRLIFVRVLFCCLYVPSNDVSFLS